MILNTALPCNTCLGAERCGALRRCQLQHLLATGRVGSSKLHERLSHLNMQQQRTRLWMLQSWDNQSRFCTNSNLLP